MKPSWGKIRIGVIALFAVAAFAIVGLRPSGRAYSATPSPTLFVTNAGTDAVTAYPGASNGDVSPLAASTGLAWPNSVAIDASGKIYVTNGCGSLAPSVTIYAKGSNGDAPPSPPSAGATPL